jgi:hypothetical protein
VASSRVDGGGGRGGVGSQGRVGSSRGPWGLRWLSIKGDGRVASWAISGVGQGGSVSWVIGGAASRAVDGPGWGGIAGAGSHGRAGDGRGPWLAWCRGQRDECRGGVLGGRQKRAGGITEEVAIAGAKNILQNEGVGRQRAMKRTA